MLLNKRKIIWIAASVVLCGSLVLSSLAAPPDGKGKGGGGGEDPSSLAPIQYAIRFVEVPGGGYHKANEMNNSGQIVGYYYLGDEQRAFLYDPTMDNPATSIGEAFDLNSLVDPTTAVPDWVIASAVGINNRGDIVGYLRPKGSTAWGDPRRGFLIDMSAVTPRLHTIPDENLGTNTYPRRINENGDILGNSLDGDVYRHYLYNPGWYDTPYWLENIPASGGNLMLLSDVLLDGQGVPVGPAVIGSDNLGLFRITPWTGGLERFDFVGNASDANGIGTFCGRGQFEVQSKKRTKQITAPYLYNSTPQIIGDQGFTATAINSSDDVLVSNFYLNHSTFELLSLDEPELLVGTTEDLNSWFSAGSRSLTDMNDRQPVTDPNELSAQHFGQILGELSDNNVYRVFLLTPQPLP